MNDKGLGVGCNGIRLSNDRPIDEGDGISNYWLERYTMLTCSNVQEVATLWEASERASGRYKRWPHMFDNCALGWCDKEDGILIIEQMHDNFIAVFGNNTDTTKTREGVLWHANHHQWLDPNATGSVFPFEYPSSQKRAERALELLNSSQNYGNITLDVCMDIMRDHEGGTDPNGKDSSDICRHPDDDDPGITMFSWIIQPKDMKVYLTHGPPCRRRYIEYNFTEIFENLNDGTLSYEVTNNNLSIFFSERLTVDVSKLLEKDASELRQSDEPVEVPFERSTYETLYEGYIKHSQDHYFENEISYKKQSII